MFKDLTSSLHSIILAISFILVLHIVFITCIIISDSSSHLSFFITSLLFLFLLLLVFYSFFFLFFQVFFPFDLALTFLYMFNKFFLKLIYLLIFSSLVHFSLLLQFSLLHFTTQKANACSPWTACFNYISQGKYYIIETKLLFLTPLF